jgi:hypothetical protein
MIKTDAEALRWLMQEVYQKGQGEFRIHTNKQGLRLYLGFKNPKITGTVKQYTTFKDGGEILGHEDAWLETPVGYYSTVVGESLTECVNLHLENMEINKNISISYTAKSNPTKLLKGTLQEFVDRYNKYQETVRKNNYHNIDIGVFSK